MKVEIKESDIKSLEKVKGKYTYTINTMNGNSIRGSEIDTIENVIKHAERELQKNNGSNVKEKEMKKTIIASLVFGITLASIIAYLILKSLY